MDLKEYLESRNISQQDFAKMLDISQTAVSNYVIYKRLPSTEIARAIEVATKGKVTVDDMIENFRKFHGK
jgi:predicted transcriptional regulator